MEANANDDGEPAPKPIWHSPGWITAIVGVVSAFLTIPEVVGDYLSKQQDIELAKQEVIAKSVSNESDKQTLEFRIVNNTLSQQGAERIFVLRYLAKTLDDEDARTWANEEVDRLDKLALLEAELANKTDQIIELRNTRPQADNENVSDPEIITLQQELGNLRNELQRLSAEAGISPALSNDTGIEATERLIDRIIIVPVQSDDISDLRRFQINSLGFSDVGAHFLVTSDGTTQNGRPISSVPAVLTGSNTGSIGIYINCPGWEPTGSTLKCNFRQNQLLALSELVSSIQGEFEIPVGRILDRGAISNRHIASTVIRDLDRINSEPQQ